MTEAPFRFDACELDPERRELSRDGHLVSLQPRVFDLLVYLVRNRDRAVDKDELMDAVWPGRVITETALTRAVMKARKAVDDDATRQAVIRTVHGHGYRFVAEVSTPVPSASPAPGNDQHAPPQAATSGHSNLRWILVPAVLFLLLGLLIWQAAPWQDRDAIVGEWRVAVLPLLDRSDDPELAWSRLGLMGLVNGLLAEAPELTTVADADVLNLAQHGAWDGPLREGVGAGLLRGLAEVHGATHVLAMELEPDGTGLRMNWVLQAAGGVAHRGTMVGDEGTRLARGVVQGVYGQLLGRSRLAVEAPLVSADPFHNEAYARGLSLSLEGRCAEAERYFQVIIDAEPTLFGPRFELASCLRILGKSEKSERMLRRLADEQRASGDGQALARVLLSLGVLLNRTGRLDQAEVVLDEALELALAQEDHELAGRVLLNLAILAEDRNDWEGSEALVDRAVLRYQRAGLEVLPGHVHSHRANLAMDQGRLAEAELDLDQAIESFRAAGDRRNEAMMLNNLGYLRRQQGRMDEAETYHRQSLAIREAIGDRVGVGRIHGMLAIVLAARGDHAGARESATVAHEVAAEAGDRLFEAVALANLGDAERALGDTAAAAAAYRESGEVFRAIDDQMRALQIELRLAELTLDQGRAGEARQAALQVLATARSRDLAQAELDAMEMLGDAALAEGEREQARLEFEAALARVRETGWSAKESRLLQKLVQLYLDDGDPVSAAPLVGALAAQEDSVAVFRLRARYASVSDDPAGAVALMERARALAGPDWDADSEAELVAYRAALP